MSTLSEYIKTQPERTMRDWADALGVSRPFLYGLLDGTRAPSLRVAVQIEAATAGRVSIRDWPNLRAVIDAARAAE